MDNYQIIEKLLNAENRKTKEKEKKNVSEDSIKFIIFSIENKKYAFPADLIKEILVNTEIFYIPFVPPYIRGIINRHGEAYTVFDLNILLNNSTLESNKFLIMNVENDQIAFIISDVIEIISVPKSELRNIPKTEDENIYFEYLFNVKSEDIFTLNINEIISKLESDL